MLLVTCNSKFNLKTLMNLFLESRIKVCCLNCQLLHHNHDVSLRRCEGLFKVFTLTFTLNADVFLTSSGLCTYPGQCLLLLNVHWGNICMLFIKCWVFTVLRCVAAVGSLPKRRTSDRSYCFGTSNCHVM